MKKTKYDVIIIGAGPVGLCCANELSLLGLKIAVVEKQSKKSISTPSYDGREIALTHHSHEILKSTGVWDLIGDKNVSLIRHAKVLNGKSSYALNFDHEEAGKDNLGFMVSNHNIRQAAYNSIKDNKNITLLCNKQVTGLNTNDQEGFVELDDGRKYYASLIISADSRFSATRKMMGVPCSTLDFQRTCIVTTMKAEKDHQDTAFECFHYDRTLAVLPLNDNSVSVVITLDTDLKDQVLGLSPEEFNNDMQKRTDNRYGEMKLEQEYFCYPLVATYAKRFFDKRFALIGDASVGMHPVTAHGFNLGLRGQHTLSEYIGNALKTGSDIGARYHLERYSRDHRKATMPLYLGTNALVKLYTKNNLGAKIARRTLLRLGNVVTPARKLISDQLTETNG